MVKQADSDGVAGTERGGSGAAAKPKGAFFFGGGKAGRRQASPLLRDMRWVYRNPAAEPKTDAQRELQKLFRDDFAKFMDRLMKLENADGERKGKADQVATVATSGPDEGRDRAMEALQFFLETWDQEQEREAARKSLSSIPSGSGMRDRV